MPSSSDSFPHLIQKRMLQLGFVTHLLTYPRSISVLFLTARVGNSDIQSSHSDMEDNWIVL